jgi:MFS superfamily sulfate permease-like transporter
MRSWVDLALMTLTFAFSIIWNVEVGIVVSIIISLLLVVRRSSKTRMAILVCSILVTVMITITTFVWAFQGRIPGTDRWKPINENQDAQEEVPGVLIIRIRESLDFGPSFDSRSLCPLCRIFTYN